VEGEEGSLSGWRGGGGRKPPIKTHFERPRILTLFKDLRARGQF